MATKQQKPLTGLITMYVFYKVTVWDNEVRALKLKVNHLYDAMIGWR